MLEDGSDGADLPFRPLSYALHLAPNLLQKGVDAVPCVATIRIRVLCSDARTITLHSQDLTYSSLTVTYNGTTQAVDTASPAFYSEGVICIAIPSGLSGVDVIVKASYTAEVPADGSGGLFLTEEGATETLATHFEPLLARSVFPCVDLPGVKARFTVSVDKRGLPAGHTVLSNTLPAVETAEEVRFEESPPLSTYLVCLVVGAMHYREAFCGGGGDGGGVPLRLRVYVSTEHSLAYVAVALRLLKEALCFYEATFDHPLGLKKIDVIGLPCLRPIAMENTGCLAFRLHHLLVTPTTPLSRVQRITRLIAHEVSHLWFGNAVGLKGWGDVWVKEGNARFLEYLFAAKMFPGWGFWGEFGYGILHKAKEQDTSRGQSHPLEGCLDTDSVSSTFDVVTYSKGAALVAMTAQCIGLSRVLSGMRCFLRQHDGHNADANDYASAMNASVGIAHNSGTDFLDVPLSNADSYDVAAFLRPWRNESSFPVVFAYRHPNSTSITLQQSIAPEVAAQKVQVRASPFALPVAVGVVSEVGVALSAVVVPTEPQGVAVEVSRQSGCVVNATGMSYCRVWYAQDVLRELLVHYKGLPASARIALVADSFSLLPVAVVLEGGGGAGCPSWWVPASAAHLGTQFYEVMRAFQDAEETHNEVVRAAVEALADLLHNVQCHPYEDKVRSAVAGYLGHLVPAVERAAVGRVWKADGDIEEFAGYEAQSMLMPEVAARVLVVLGSAGHVGACTLAQGLKAGLVCALQRAPDAATPDLLVSTAAVRVCVAHGTDPDWADAWRLCHWAALVDSDTAHIPTRPVTQGLGWLRCALPAFAVHEAQTVPQGYVLTGSLIECLAASPQQHIAVGVAEVTGRSPVLQSDLALIAYCKGALCNAASMAYLLPHLQSSKLLWFLVMVSVKLNFGSPTWLTQHRELWEHMDASIHDQVEGRLTVTEGIIKSCRLLTAGGAVDVEDVEGHTPP